MFGCQRLIRKFTTRTPASDMKIAVLDTNVLVRRPEVLSRRLEDYHLIVPRTVVDELRFTASKRRHMKSLPDLLQSAVKAGVVRIDEAPGAFVSSSATHVHTLGDAEILRYLEYRQTQGDEVLFVSDDAKLLASAKNLGLKTATTANFPPPARSSEPPNAELAGQVRKILQKQWISLGVSFVAGVVASLSASFLLPAALRLTSTLHVWGPLVALLLLGPLIYAVRSRFRAWYGITEFLVGLVTAARVFWPNFDVTTIDAESVFKILGGIYIMVRGLDNIGKAVEGTPFERVWMRLEGRAVE